MAAVIYTVPQQAHARLVGNLRLERLAEQRCVTEQRAVKIAGQQEAYRMVAEPAVPIVEDQFV